MEREIVILHKRVGKHVTDYRPGRIVSCDAEEAAKLVENGLAIYRPGGQVETASLQNRSVPDETKTLAANAEEKKKRGRPKKVKTEE